jgi:hypothetical protein
VFGISAAGPRNRSAPSGNGVIAQILLIRRQSQARCFGKCRLIRSYDLFGEAHQVPAKDILSGLLQHSCKPAQRVFEAPNAGFCSKANPHDIGRLPTTRVTEFMPHEGRTSDLLSSRGVLGDS